jgi:hypothetical protein
MARWTSITASADTSTVRAVRLSRGAIACLGVAIAVAGALSFERTWHTGGLVAAVDGLRGNGETLPPARLETAISQLEAQHGARAAELGALAFFHYAAADEALVHGDRTAWQRELIAAGAAARQALSLSPARADLALALAEIEFLRGGPGPNVYQPLELSYRIAPRELWVVQRRIGLGLRLIAVAPRDVVERVISDIHTLGAPFADTDQYRILAQAAYVAGPAALAIVERELGRGHPWPFGAFETFLGELRARETARAGGQ